MQKSILILILNNFPVTNLIIESSEVASKENFSDRFFRYSQMSCDFSAFIRASTIWLIMVFPYFKIKSCGGLLGTVLDHFAFEKNGQTLLTGLAFNTVYSTNFY